MNSAWDRMYLDFSQKRPKIVKLLAGAVPFPVVSVPKLGKLNPIGAGRTLHGESNTVSCKSPVAGCTVGTRVGAIFD
jgi:hypothetical protein